MAMHTPPDPQAFLLLNLPAATLTVNGATSTGTLSLECVTIANPMSTGPQDRDVYLVFRINGAETVIDPQRIVRCLDSPPFRTYSFSGTPTEPSDLIVQVRSSALDIKGDDGPDLDTFENILEQYVSDFQRPFSQSSAALPMNINGATGSDDLRGRLVMINEDTGEVLGEVQDRIKIREDPSMHEPGRQNDPIIVEIPDSSLTTQQSDANALEAFAHLVPPDQQTWMTKSASVVGHAISMTTTLLVTTITTASNYYVSHSEKSPHHSNAGTPTASGSRTPSGEPGKPPPLPPRALVFLTSEKTRKNLQTVHAFSGQAVKVSSKTVGVIDSMIRRAMGAKSKRQKHFAHGVPPAGPSGASTPNLLSPSPQPPLRTLSQGYPSNSTLSPPPYTTAPQSYFSAEKGVPPTLPPRRSPSPAPPLPPRAGTAPSYFQTPAVREDPSPVKLTTKDRVLISLDLIFSTLDDSTRRVLDASTESFGKVMGHKYGPEAEQSSLLMAGTARNVGLVYVDMKGIGRRALLKRAGKTFVKARLSSNKPGPELSQANSPPMK